MIYNVQYWNSTTIVVCSRSIRLQLRTYIYLTQKWIDLKYYASNAKTYTNEIAWLRCNKKSDTATALEVKMQCLSFSVYHISKTSMQVKGQSTFISCRRSSLWRDKLQECSFFVWTRHRGKSSLCIWKMWKSFIKHNHRCRS